MTETEYISQSLTKVRRFARENDVHVWLVAHPTKLRRQENGSYPVPTPYDISGSAHWRNKADNALAVWRDTSEFNNPIVQIHIQKIRFKEIGQPGMVELRYNRINGTYREVAT
jgi:twinkle protein